MPIVNNDGVKVHYVVEGKGTPIVMIHASMGSYLEWYGPDYINALKNEYMLVLVDLRGHGQSDKPIDSKSYLAKDFSSDIIAVMNDLKITKAHCWGYSMGGTIAFWLSRYYPERFLSFIIGGAYPQKYTDESLKRQEHVKELLQDGADGLITYLIERGDKITPEGEKRLREMDYDVINAWMNSDDLFNDVDQHLPDLDIPFLFYAGEKDEWNPYPHLVEIADKMKNAKAILFSNAGHDVHYRKGVVLPYVKKFLKS